MKNSKEMLSSILKTTQMGQIGIRCVLDHRMETDLRKTLEAQLKEYDSIESEAHILASQRGMEPSELDPAVRSMAGMMVRMKLAGRHSNSGIADMMIQGNTRGTIKQLKNIHRYSGSDESIMQLNQKLLEAEKANIRQMEFYL